MSDFIVRHNGLPGLPTTPEVDGTGYALMDDLIVQITKGTLFEDGEVELTFRALTDDTPLSETGYSIRFAAGPDHPELSPIWDAIADYCKFSMEFEAGRDETTRKNASMKYRSLTLVPVSNESYFILKGLTDKENENSKDGYQRTASEIAFHDIDVVETDLGIPAVREFADVSDLLKVTAAAAPAARRGGRAPAAAAPAAAAPAVPAGLPAAPRARARGR